MASIVENDLESVNGKSFASRQCEALQGSSASKLGGNEIIYR
jgi:hypothetical protein